MREPWDLAQQFIGNLQQQAAQSRNVADNALMRMFGANIDRQNAGVAQGYNLDTLAKRNEYATQADTIAFDRQLTRDNTAYDKDDQRYALRRQHALEDAKAAGAGAREMAILEQKLQAEREMARGEYPAVSQRRIVAPDVSTPAGAPISAAAPAGASPQMTAGGDPIQSAIPLLREFEGFSDDTYWDVNHHRVGYGSDTITNPDGSVRTVRQGDRIDRGGAELDLARRVAEEDRQAAQMVGQQEWARLPPNVRTGLLSTAYNYGSLPDSVIAAARSGDVNAISQAVMGLSGHNGGVNAKRRAREAAIIAGNAASPEGGPRRYTDEGANNPVSTAILGLPVSNSASSSMTDENGKPIVPEWMDDYFTEIGREPVEIVKMTQGQLDLIDDPRVKSQFFPYVTSNDTRKPNEPALYVRTRPKENANAGDLPRPGAGQTVGPKVELKEAPRKTFKDGKFVLDDGTEMVLPD